MFLELSLLLRSFIENYRFTSGLMISLYLEWIVAYFYLSYSLVGGSCLASMILAVLFCIFLGMVSECWCLLV